MKELSKSKFWNFVWLYRFIYGGRKNLPNNICGYVWSLLLGFIPAVVSGLMSLPFRIFEDQRNDLVDDGVLSGTGFLFAVSGFFIGWIAVPVLVYIIFCMIVLLFQHNKEAYYFAPGMAGWTIFSIAGIVLFILYCIEKVKQAKRKRRWETRKYYNDDEPEKPSALRIWWQDFKAKRCSKIEWID